MGCMHLFDSYTKEMQRSQMGQPGWSQEPSGLAGIAAHADASDTAMRSHILDLAAAWDFGAGLTAKTGGSGSCR